MSDKDIDDVKQELIDELEKEFYARHDYVILKPGEEWVPGNKKIQIPKFKSMNSEPKCTCGVDKVGYGIHSDWCDKAVK